MRTSDAILTILCTQLWDWSLLKKHEPHWDYWQNNRQLYWGVNAVCYKMRHFGPIPKWLLIFTIVFLNRNLGTVGGRGNYLSESLINLTASPIQARNLPSWVWAQVSWSHGSATHSASTFRSPLIPTVDTLYQTLRAGRDVQYRLPSTVSSCSWIVSQINQLNVNMYPLLCTVSQREQAK